ncbi:MAG TPA: MGMT family protein [Chloroflexota bacterium]|nr:MGMT family protein [Chloroflexota bacterium]
MSSRRVPQVDGAFRQRVYEIVSLIPHGKVATYGFVSTLAGAPRQARQVGWALHTLPRELAEDGKVPWQRVINAKGQVSTHPDEAGTYRQIALLREEGIPVTDDGVLVNGLAAHQWEPDPKVVERLELPAEVLFHLDRQLESKLG